ncbi:MAG: ribonucleoside-diphosphate reductase subunit alpha, partial [Planctomycetales bacterium]|nr:ribonucleoside-diphosphate reductase subunit alpha [Planctomycetales bacterium]
MLGREMMVTKRDGRVVSFEAERIQKAMEKAFCADRGLESPEKLDEKTQLAIVEMVEHVVIDVQPLTKESGVDVERIQDLVEKVLMRFEYYAVARKYILYRDEHARRRRLNAEEQMESDEPFPMVMVRVGSQLENFDHEKLRAQLAEACQGLEGNCSVDRLFEDFAKQLYPEITAKEIGRAMVLVARALIEVDPDYDKVAGRLMLGIIYREALGRHTSGDDLAALYQETFAKYLEDGIGAGRLAPEMRNFDAQAIAAALHPERDALFPYLGLQTIYDRYLLHIDGRRIETPQYFWMRVAMGLSIREDDPTARAIEFYNMLSSFRFTSATPTLFNAGTLHPQLSSCYLSTVSDDLDHIFKVISDNAKLSKWAGGLGNDWTSIRATNAHIKGTNGRSQGVIPFLKVVSDTAVAVNQGGKRKGAVCSYLETWHLDVEEFLDLRKNTGDERRRTHDMHTANWIPDLFMKRVMSNQDWTLFSPDEVPDLHDLTGRAFEQRYEFYEQEAREGRIKISRTVSAVGLWRKMLTRLFETGHPWITWKDPSNLRSPQDHCGVVHSSNLCTEILLNTSKDETAVCNLG